MVHSEPVQVLGSLNEDLQKFCKPGLDSEVARLVARMYASALQGEPKTYSPLVPLDVLLALPWAPC